MRLRDIRDVASFVEDSAGMRWSLASMSASRFLHPCEPTLSSISASPTDTSKRVSPLALLCSIHSSRASTAASRCVAGEERYAGRCDGILAGDIAVLRAVGGSEGFSKCESV